MIKFLFSFETVFVLWLFSYQYKNGFEVFSSPDITILLTLVLIPWGITLYYKDKAKQKLNDPVFLSFLAVSLWFITSSFWSPSHTYKLEKTMCYALYTIPGFLIGYIVIAKDPERIKRLMWAFGAFALLVLLETYHIFHVNGLSSVSNILNTNYLVTGQTLGAGLLVLLALTTEAKKLGRLALGSQILLMSFMFYALINLGGRGPVIAAGSAIGCFYGVRCWKESALKPLIHLGIFSLCCIFFVFVLNGFFEHSSSHFHQRLAPLLTGHIDEAVNERFDYYKSALSIFLDHPLIGVGFGGWPVLAGLGDISLHPHNIFLEVLSETGIIGFILLVIFFYYIFRSLKFFSLLTSSPERASLALLTIFSFINAQKTGDVHDNLLLFVMLSLCAGINKDMSPKEG